MSVRLKFRLEILPVVDFYFAAGFQEIVITFTILGNCLAVRKWCYFLSYIEWNNQKHFGNGRNSLFNTEERKFKGRLTRVVHTFFVVAFLAGKVCCMYLSSISQILWRLLCKGYLKQLSVSRQHLSLPRYFFQLRKCHASFQRNKATFRERRRVSGPYILAYWKDLYL